MFNKQHDKGSQTMTTELMARGTVLLLVGLLVTGCDTRGTFGAGACGAGDRVSVDANAVSAIYFDKAGNPLGARAEELDGTLKNTMCQTPEPEGPSACPAGYCARTIMGKTYCMRC